LAVMAFIAARALPRVVVEGITEPSIYAAFTAWLNRLPLHHVDERINVFLFKFLKRSRVFVMKLDNRLMRYLDRVKKSGEQGNTHVQDMIDHVQGEKGE
jgi:hypothetical protein